jgi:hypothetical protein
MGRMPEDIRPFNFLCQKVGAMQKLRGAKPFLESRR